VQQQSDHRLLEDKLCTVFLERDLVTNSTLELICACSAQLVAHARNGKA
jgi:hypothetical protein